MNPLYLGGTRYSTYLIEALYYKPEDLRLESR
jgi:hypothetical protein